METNITIYIIKGDIKLQFDDEVLYQDQSIEFKKLFEDNINDDLQVIGSTFADFDNCEIQRFDKTGRLVYYSKIINI